MSFSPYYMKHGKTNHILVVITLSFPGFKAKPSYNFSIEQSFTRA